MGSILDNYKRQLEEDRANETNEFDMPTFDEELNGLDKSIIQNVDADAVAKKVKELRESSDDMENLYKQFNQEYPRIKENEMDENGLTKMDENIKMMVKRAYCPNCKREIVSKVPLLFNPYTMEKIAKYECACGAKFNFEHSYPRIIYVDSDGNEIKAFAD